METGSGSRLVPTSFSAGFYRMRPHPVQARRLFPFLAGKWERCSASSRLSSRSPCRSSFRLVFGLPFSVSVYPPPLFRLVSRSVVRAVGRGVRSSMRKAGRGAERAPFSEARHICLFLYFPICLYCFYILYILYSVYNFCIAPFLDMMVGEGDDLAIAV